LLLRHSLGHFINIGLAKTIGDASRKHKHEHGDDRE
jgi:hypothetical protein